MKFAHVIFGGALVISFAPTLLVYLEVKDPGVWALFVFLQACFLFLINVAFSYKESILTILWNIALSAFLMTGIMTGTSIVAATQTWIQFESPSPIALAALVICIGIVAYGRKIAKKSGKLRKKAEA